MLNHNKLSKNLLNLHYSPENIVVTISKDGKAKYPTGSFILKYKKSDKDAEFLQSTINEEVISRLSFDFLPTDR